MKPLKQCCACHRVLVGRSARTGREHWRPARKVIPVSHGLCPFCVPAFAAEVQRLRAALQHRAL